MPLSRRKFLELSSITAGVTAATSLLDLPALAMAEPRGGVKVAASEILLNSNENPYGAFPSVRKAMVDAVSISNRYPDYEFDALWESLAKLHGCKTEEITLGAGSTDILRMAAVAFCSPAKPLVMGVPTFEALGMYAARNGTPSIKVPLRADYAHDLEQMLAKAKQSAGLVYICNPNNPTGSLTPRKEIEQLISELPAETYVLIDEAYHHFVQQPADYVSFADKRVSDPRVIVARTFSKIYGMAGLRLGYAVGAKETIERLSASYVYDNPNCIAARAGVAALADRAALAEAIRRAVRDREQFNREASARGLKSIPSHANFVMLDAGRPTQTVIDHFKAHHVLIGRPFPPLDTHVRISLGTPPEMKQFWSVWDMLPKLSN
jgi:histidinol-phosphate aminotransferase